MEDLTSDFNPNGDVKKFLQVINTQFITSVSNIYIRSKKFGTKVAKKYDIKLIFYGENEAEYGNPIADNELSLRINLLL